jgi:hypothetical protein
MEGKLALAKVKGATELVAPSFYHIFVARFEFQPRPNLIRLNSGASSVRTLLSSP